MKVEVVWYDEEGNKTNSKVFNSLLFGGDSEEDGHCAGLVGTYSLIDLVLLKAAIDGAYAENFKQGMERANNDFEEGGNSGEGEH